MPEGTMAPRNDVTTREMEAVAVIGTGYVGLTTAVGLAELGHQVVGVDIDPEKVASLQRGRVTIHEEGLDPMLRKAIDSGRLRFTTDCRQAIAGVDFIFVAVATPMGRDGEPDLDALKKATTEVARGLTHSAILVIKSTVPVGTGELVAGILAANLREAIPVQVVYHPEFLREGTAMQNFMRPDRLIFGSASVVAANRVAGLFRSLPGLVVITDLHTAEMVKYASNAFLATRISFINEIAGICEAVRADVTLVAEAMGMDHRIGPKYLEAGIGYGGSCLPKDVRALSRLGQAHGARTRLLEAVMEINHGQRELIVRKLEDALVGLGGTTIGILGLAFKPGTDDIRDAPSREIVRSLVAKGARVRAYDPVAMPAFGRSPEGTHIGYASDPYAAAADADAVAVLTEWEEFRSLDLERLRLEMRRPILVDGRNIYDPQVMRRLGFDYRGIGRVTEDSGRVSPAATIKVAA